MFYKNYQNMATATEMISTFGGYCHKDVIGDGQWYEMTNMSARKAPAICTRKNRQILTAVNGEAVGNVAAIVDMDGLVWLGKDGSLHAGGHKLDNFYTYTEAERQMIPMGGYLIVFPDKVWANAVKLRMGGEMVEGEDYGSLEAHWAKTEDQKISMTLVHKSANGYTEFSASDTTIRTHEPENKTNGQYWLDTSHPWEATMKQWSQQTRMWSTVETAVKFYCPDIGKHLKTNDCVTIQNVQESTPFITFQPWDGHGSNYYSQLDTCLKAMNGDSVHILERNPDHIIIPGMLPELTYQIGNKKDQLLFGVIKKLGFFETTGKTPPPSLPATIEEAKQMTEAQLEAAIGSFELADVTISRTVPEMNYVIECGNRLWGCYYGQGKDGTILNEIYASKLGDFKNWNSFQGLSTDSYAASRGTDGPWTGAITMNNFPLFFKRNYLEKVYISASGAHQITTTKMPGVQPGSHRSMQIVDGVLFYLSDNGVMVYDGSLPDHISEDFGDVKYKNGVAGKQGYNYYLSVQAQDGTNVLFNLDTTKGTWHKEDGTRLIQTADRGDVLYLLANDGRLMTPGELAEADQGVEENDFTWEIVSGPIGYQRAEQEYLLRLIPRIKLEPGASAYLHVMYDDNGTWQRVACIEGNGTQSMKVPVKPRRCDHFRIRLSGIGTAVLYTITREIEKGSVET